MGRQTCSIKEVVEGESPLSCSVEETLLAQSVIQMSGGRALPRPRAARAGPARYQPGSGRLCGFRASRNEPRGALLMRYYQSIPQFCGAAVTGAESFPF
jgi:hypothetical protein